MSGFDRGDGAREQSWQRLRTGFRVDTPIVLSVETQSSVFSPRPRKTVAGCSIPDTPMKPYIAKTMKWGGLALLVCVVALQFWTVDRTNPEVDPNATIQARISIPRNVQSIMTSACMDCHSNATEWPWFSAVAPMSWTVSEHVHEARHELNFSEWTTYSPRKQRDLLQKIADVVRNERMPPSLYRTVHPEAQISTDARFTIYFWAKYASSLLASQRGDTTSSL